MLLLWALLLPLPEASLGAGESSGGAAHEQEGKGPINAKLERLEGGKLKLSELRGQPVLLEMWATWCLPCREQSRIVTAAAADLASRQVRVLSVNQGESRADVESFLESQASHFPVVLDRWQAVSGQLGVGELPALALLDSDGTVARLRTGLTSADALSAMLQALDRTRVPTPAD